MFASKPPRKTRRPALSVFGGAGLGGGLVIGAIADAQYLNGQNGTTFAPGTTTFGQNRSTNYFGMAGGRLGFAIDRALIYGTGGYAYNLRNDGYTVGGGVEVGVTPNVSIGAEYLYVDLRRGGNSIAATGTSTFQRGDFSIARGFVNFRLDAFQTAAAPVVAQY